MNLSQLHVTSAAVAAIIACGFAVGDLWAFHALAKDSDLAIFFLGLGGLGLTGAYSAGLHSDPVAPPLPSPPAAP